MIGQQYKEDEMIILNGEHEGGSSINFYLHKPVYILNARSANLEYGSYFSDAPKIFLKDADLARLWTEQKRVYLFSQSDDLETLVAS
jgi:hypothetical protein